MALVLLDCLFFRCMLKEKNVPMPVNVFFFFLLKRVYSPFFVCAAVGQSPKSEDLPARQLQSLESERVLQSVCSLTLHHANVEQPQHDSPDGQGLSQSGDEILQVHIAFDKINILLSLEANDFKTSNLKKCIAIGL